MKNTLYINGLKPPLKWAGGKRWLVPHLQPLWEPYSHRRLVEPLCGGLAVTLALMPEKALLNGINTHLINFFRWLQKGLYIDIPLENKEEFYYSHRERFNTLIEEGKKESKEAAALFYYLNRTGYNSLCRFNQKDRFNVPFGRNKKINYIRDYEKYREVFKRWGFACTDFEELVLNDDDFIYADLPYCGAMSKKRWDCTDNSCCTAFAKLFKSCFFIQAIAPLLTRSSASSSSIVLE